jgi:hypothetical protein
MKQFLLFAGALFILATARAQQGVSISADGSSPHGSAMLDIRSSSKGLLIPRMSALQRSSISNPATGLLVYQQGSAADGFYYYNGSNWVALAAPAGSSAGWSLTGNSNTDSSVNFIGTLDAQPLIGRVDGEQVLYLSERKSTIALGYQAGKMNTGINNSFLGYQAGQANTTGSGNLFIGGLAGYSNSTGTGNHFEGLQAGQSNSTGSRNFMAGFNTGFSNTTGSYNVYLGYNAGYNNKTGDANLFLGYEAGKAELGSNKLYISNSATTDPLLYGEFDNKILKVNGQLTGRTTINNEGAVVGINDGPGYGLVGYSTGQDGYGLLAAAGTTNIYTHVARLENLSPLNAADLVEIYNVPNAQGAGLRVITYSDVKPAVDVYNPSTNATGVFSHVFAGSQAFAFWGKADAGQAGHFDGDVQIIGTLSKSAGTFKIDHPMDPANKYLIHSFVESPDMMNVYNGNAKTDAKGMVTVTLPSYFEAENIDFKYQLTVMDENSFAMARIAKKVSNNQFVIMTSLPNIEVSWQVTGIRNDAYAQKHRIVPEVMKTKEEAGKYLNPDLFGHPKSKAIYYKDDSKELESSAKPITVPASSSTQK